MDFGKAGLLDKARQQPEKVKMVLEKVQTDGLMPTVEAVRAKLQHPIPLGYSNVGVVTEVGKNMTGFEVGDRVVSNGHHADVVQVPRNLAVRIPDDVDDETATFTVLASIGLQGIRLVQPTLGEAVVVTGVGLIGLLTVQLLKAQGCRVLAIDFDESKLALARQFGAETFNAGGGGDPVSAGMSFSRGNGVDAVIITAATKSSDPVSQAARMSRKRGRIVLVGVTGLELNRADFYEKEISFQVSCSYGPGRYDPDYEDKGRDYPIGFVRWTEGRNFEAVLDLMAAGKLDTKSLISHRIDFEDVSKAYDVLSNEKSVLGILLKYASATEQREIKNVSLQPVETNGNLGKAGRAVIGLIGAGNYASRTLIPAFKEAGGFLHTIMSAGGVNAIIHGRKSGFSEASSDISATLGNEAINTIVIATRHDSHADLVLKSLKANKNVFVEKPLCLTLEELEAIEAYFTSTGDKKDVRPLLSIGFNRRFAPHIQKMKSLLGTTAGPKSFVVTINAGDIPEEHWTQDILVGGGRIVGEACHFVDLIRYLAGNPIASFSAESLGPHPSLKIRDDKASISLKFDDGSMGTIHYLANGHKGFPKERIEVFVEGRILQLDNFRTLKGWGWKGFSKMRAWKQDKGQSSFAKAFVMAVETGGPPPIPLSELFEVSRVSIEIANSLR